MSDMEGKVTRVGARERSRGGASDIDGQNREVEWSFGKSDIEGKVARVATRKRGRDRVSNGREQMSQRGQRTSFKTLRYWDKAKVDLQSLVLRAPPRPDSEWHLRVERNGGSRFFAW